MSVVDTYTTSEFFADEALAGALERAKQIVRDQSRSVEDQAKAALLAVDFQKQLDAMRNQHGIFMQRLLEIDAPSPEIIQKAIELMQRLAARVSSDILADGVVEAIVGIIVDLGQLAKKPAGAAADAQGAEALSAQTLKSMAFAATATHWRVKMKQKLGE